MAKFTDYKNLTELLDQHSQIAQDVNKINFLNNNVDIVDSINYLQLSIKAKSIATKLQAYTQPGDRILLLYPPGIEFICAFFGCLYAGVIAVPAYPPVEKKLIEKLQGMIQNAEPKVILSNKFIVDQIKKLKYVKALNSISFLDGLIKTFLTQAHELSQWDFDKFRWITTDDLSTDYADNYSTVSIEPYNIAFLQYTSGSTGQPKGVMVTHKNILANSDIIDKKLNNEEDQVGVIWLPPYHDMGLIGGILYPIAKAFPIYLMSPMTFLRNPLAWVSAIHKFKGTTSAAPNFAYGLCNKKISDEQKKNLQLGSMRAFLNGAEPINAKTVNQFVEKFSECGVKQGMFLPCYGLAESTLIVSGKQGLNVGCFSKSELMKNNVKTLEKNDKDAIDIISCGPADQGVVIVDPVTNKQCMECEIGEIWVVSDSVARGYWNREIESQETFQAKIDGDNATNYMRTGDLAFMLNNELFVMGRIKDLIIINGMNHYPHDIERSIDGIHPAIHNGNYAAVSIEVDEKECLALVLEIDERKVDDFDVIISKLRQVVMEDHRLPVHTIAFIRPKTLQKTTSGKIKRQPTRLALMGRKLEIVSLWQANEVDEEVTDIVNSLQSNVTNNFNNDLRMKIRTELQDVLNIDINQIDDTKNFTEFGLDSLMAIELENRLQNYLKDICHLDNSVIMNYPTIESLSNHIEQQIISSNDVQAQTSEE